MSQRLSQIQHGGVQTEIHGLLILGTITVPNASICHTQDLSLGCWCLSRNGLKKISQFGRKYVVHFACWMQMVTPYITKPFPDLRSIESVTFRVV
jgi:hypothetical protein